MKSSENQNRPQDVCADCGTVIEGGKAGCLKIFEEILAREFSDYRYGRIHRLTVDAYSLQHPDEYMRSGKSFAAHLTGIYSALECEDSLSVNQTVQKWLSMNPKIERPTQLPAQRGDLTIAYIHSAANAEEHTRRVQEWARDVWAAWVEYHELARRLISQATAEISQS
jgi:hypothetical protein